MRSAYIWYTPSSHIIETVLPVVITKLLLNKQAAAVHEASTLVYAGSSRETGVFISKGEYSSCTHSHGS